MSLSTHVLDAARGRPAGGVPIHWESRAVNGAWSFTAAGVTGPDGRIAGNGWIRPGRTAASHGAEPVLGVGQHRLIFDTGAWFLIEGLAGFFPEVVVTFAVTDPTEHHHIPLLLSPYSYSIHRGS